MARIKILSNLEKAFKSKRPQEIRKKSKDSLGWLKNRVQKAFGGKVKSIGNKWELETQNAIKKKATTPKGKPFAKPTVDTELGQVTTGNVVNRNKPVDKRVEKNLKANTTVDDRFKKQLKKTTKSPEPGRLYFFIYDPKWKAILPYYDTFPLVFPIAYYPDGFLGLNVHYLPYMLRAKLMDVLLSYQKEYIDVQGNPQKYLEVTYGILKGLSGSKYYAPTIHRYLYHHVRSPFTEVLSEEWENAVFLPVEQFKKANKREVWVDSKTKIG